MITQTPIKQNKPKQKAALFISHNQFSYYSEGKTSILQVTLSETSLKDLEVLNKDEVKQQLTAFIDQNKITPAIIFIVLAQNTYFQKTVPSSEMAKLEEFKQLFLNIIPFEHISAKVYKNPKESYIIAANTELYETIKEAFEAKGFIIEGVIPQSILGQLFVSKNVFDYEIGKYIIKHFESLKQESLLEQQMNSSDIHYAIMSQKQLNKKKPLLLYLLPLLIILLGVLIWLLVFSQKSTVLPIPAVIAIPTISPSPAVVTSQPTPTESMAVESSPSAVLSSTPSVGLNENIDKTKIKIQILNGSGIPGQADKLSDQLISLGFSDVKIGNTTTTSQKTLITFKQTVPAVIRNTITIELKKIFSAITNQENPEQEFDIVIVTGKSS